MKAESENVRWGFFSTREGYCAISWTNKGLFALVLPQKSWSSALRKLRAALPRIPVGFWNRQKSTVPGYILKYYKQSFFGKPFQYEMADFSGFTAFQKKIYRATLQIPYGQTKTYGWIAKRAGSPKSCRAAGNALNRNPLPVFIPCHRVIGNGNNLGGFGSGIGWKIRLLKAEGVIITRGREGSYRVQKL